MKIVFNLFTDEFDYVDGGVVPSGTTDPSTPRIGLMFLNTAQNELKIYYAGVWQILHTFTGGNGYWNDITNTWNDMTCKWNQV